MNIETTTELLGSNFFNSDGNLIKNKNNHVALNIFSLKINKSNFRQNEYLR